MRTRSGVVGAGLLGAGLLITAMLWSAQDAKHAGAQAVSALDGSYLRVESSTASEDATRNDAIARGTANLSVATRNRWRGILEEMARPSQRVELRRESRDLVVKNENRVELRSAATGAVAEVEGGWELDQRVVDGTLVQHVETDRVAGEALPQPVRQTLRYSLSSDQQRLTIQTRIEGGVLPTAILFSVTYQRG